MICIQCNKEFTPSHGRQKYCSDKCIKNKSKDYNKAYKKSDKGKTNNKKYKQTLKGKIANRKGYTKFSKTEKGIILNRKRQKIYQQTDYAKTKNSAWWSNRRKSDPIFKASSYLRSRLINFLRSRGIKKTNKTLKMIGCTPKFLKKHFEKQFHRHPDTHQPMNWKNHTVHGWHIDHIIPLDSAKTPEDVEKLMHYTNLQPLWAEYNIKKSNKII